MSTPQGSLKPTQPFDPPTHRMVQCAVGGCPNTFRMVDGYLFPMSMTHRGPDARLGGFQCPPHSEIAHGNIEAQHFGCSPEHALAAAFFCARDHILPEHAAEVAHLAALDAQAAIDAQKALAAQQTIGGS